jgi:hypothetical protein
MREVEKAMSTSQDDRDFIERQPPFVDERHIGAKRASDSTVELLTGSRKRWEVALQIVAIPATMVIAFIVLVLSWNFN